jgi:hypothetical protein
MCPRYRAACNYLIPTWLPSLLGSEPGPAPRVEPGSKGHTFIRNLLLHGGHADAHRCGPAAHDAAAASPAAADALAVVPCTAAGVATVTTAGVAACTCRVRSELRC